MKNPSRTRNPAPAAIKIWSLENFICVPGENIGSPSTKCSGSGAGEQITSVTLCCCPLVQAFLAAAKGQVKKTKVIELTVPTTAEEDKKGGHFARLARYEVGLYTGCFGFGLTRCVGRVRLNALRLLEMVF